MRRIAFVAATYVGFAAIACDSPSSSGRGARAIQAEVLGGIGVGMREREARWRAEKVADGDVECDSRGLCRFAQGGPWPGGVTFEVVDGKVRTVTHDFDHPSWGDSASAAADAIGARIEELAGRGSTRPDSLVVWRDRATDQVMIFGCRERDLAAPCLLVASEIPDPG